MILELGHRLPRVCSLLREECWLVTDGVLQQPQNDPGLLRVYEGELQQRIVNYTEKSLEALDGDVITEMKKTRSSLILH